MNRRLSLLALSFFLAACSVHHGPRPVAVDPVSVTGSIDPTTDPSVVGSIDEAVVAAGADAEEGARVGRRVGRVLGAIAAVFGGSEYETLDETIDRYRRTRDAAEVAGAVIGAAKGAKEGAEIGFARDVQFAELHELSGVVATRPYADEIELRLERVDEETVHAIGAVLAEREQRAIDIVATAETGDAIRQALIDEGVATTINVRPAEVAEEVILRIRYESPAR